MSPEIALSQCRYCLVMVTEVQLEKFEAFQVHPLRDRALKLMKSAIEAAGLSLSTLGQDWGVTVCPDRKTVFRINRGNYALLDMRMMALSDGPNPKEEMCVVLAVVESQLGRRNPKGTVCFEGFVKHVPDSMVLCAVFDGVGERLLEDKKTCRAFAAHSLTGVRKLPNPKWHNPAVNQLLI
ncbi:MAG: hypothetical protein RI939_410 [Actinomycetota bacterium]